MNIKHKIKNDTITAKKKPSIFKSLLYGKKHKIVSSKAKLNNRTTMDGVQRKEARIYSKTSPRVGKHKAFHLQKKKRRIFDFKLSISIKPVAKAAKAIAKSIVALVMGLSSILSFTVKKILKLFKIRRKARNHNIQKQTKSNKLNKITRPLNRFINLFKQIDLMRKTLLISTILILITTIYFQKSLYVQSATYIWEQLSWADGIPSNSGECATAGGTWTGTECAASHTSNQTGWAAYSAADANLTIGTDVTLALAAASTTDTTDAEFNAGTPTINQTEVTGDSVKLDEETPSVYYSSGTFESGSIDLGVKANFSTLDATGIGTTMDPGSEGPSLWEAKTNAPGNFDYGGGLAYDGGDYIYSMRGGSTAFDVYSISCDAWNVVSSPDCVTSNDPSNSTWWGAGYGAWIVYPGSGDSIYASGGGNSSALWEYSILGDSWTRVTDAPSVNGWGSTGVYTGGDYIYASHINSEIFSTYSISCDAWNVVSSPDCVTAFNPTDASASFLAGADTAYDGSNYIYATHANGGTGFSAYSISDNSWNVVKDPADLPVDANPGSSLDYPGSGDYIYYMPGTVENFYAYSIANDDWTTYNPTDFQTDQSYGGSDMIYTGLENGLFSTQGNSTAGFNRFTPPEISATVQLAANNDDSTWNFQGPDGTSSTYFESTGQSIDSSLDGNQYVKYKLFNSTGLTSITPSLDDITVNYSSYSASQTLTSSAYNTTDSANVLNRLTWTEDISGANTNVRFQVRTAPDSGGSPGTWTSWCGPDNAGAGCDTGTYFTDPAGTETVDADMTDTSNDQWIQYKAYLTSDGENTPTLSDINIRYVVNATPAITVNSAVQNSNGTISINYDLVDSDTATNHTVYIMADFGITLNETLDSSDTTITLSDASDLPTSGTIQIDNEQITYTGKSSNDLTGCTRASNNSSAAAHSSGAVIWAVGSTVSGDLGPGQSTGAGKTGTWTITTDYSDIYRTSGQGMIRISSNDGEIANQVGSGNSSNFEIDTTDPVLGTPSVIVNNITDVVTLSASDDTALDMQVGLASDLSDASWETYNTTKSDLTLLSDPETVYAQFRDAYGNISSIVSATTPGQPSNVVYYDISNAAASDWREFIAWGEVNQLGSGFSYYDIDISTDGVNYSDETQISSGAGTNFYTDIGLSTSNTYYYKIATVDTDGNRSAWSSVVSDQPDGQGSSDTTSPTISNVSTSGLDTSQITITWDTDELANSTVGYSTSSGVFTTQTGSSTMVTSHSVTLTGLTPNTTYYYQIISADPLSNSITDNNGGGGYTFTTDPGPAISNVSASTDNTQTTINWITDINADSHIIYSTGVTAGSLDAPTTTVGSTSLVGGTSIFNHNQDLTGLSQGTTYYFYVQSTDGSSNTATDNNGGSFYSFITTQDDDAPVISSVSSVLTSDTGAAINWTTNEASNGTVNYGTTSGSLTSSASITTYDRSHYVILTGLEEDTTYYYAVTSADINTNSVTSSEYSFDTLEELYTFDEFIEESTEDRELLSSLDGPSISGVKTTDLGGESVTIKWSTDALASSLVKYGVTDEYGNVAGTGAVISDINEYVTSHSVIINGLIPDTKYYYAAVSVDVIGNIGVSGQKTFTTKSPSTLTSVKVESKSLGEAIVTWNTSKDTTSIVDYGLTTSYGEIQENSVKTKEHEIILSNLLPGQTYHFRVKGKDSDNNLYSSNDYTFLPKSPPRITDVVSESISEHSMKITFITDVPTDALVTYTDTNDDTNSGSQGKPDMTTNHEIELLNLSPGTTYEMRIKVKDEEGNETEDTEQGFTTGIDENPPTIEQIKTDTALSQGDKVQALISWNTDEPADTSLIYKEGRDGQEREVKVNQNYTLGHISVITTFKAGTVYYFKAKSIDQADNESVSSEHALLTPRRKENIIQVIINNFQEIFGWARF